MPEFTDKLLSIASDAIGTRIAEESEVLAFLTEWGEIGRDLAGLLMTRNGFWSYESSLLVRPFENVGPPHGVQTWNSKSVWKNAFKVNLEHVMCFAEDVFGCQFCIVNDHVGTFDPETCEIDDFAESLEVWSKKIIEDFDYCTGYPLAHEWQLRNEILAPGARLLPKTPFVLGGEYSIENLYMLDEVEGMCFRASIANQIRDVADGGTVVLEIERRGSVNDSSV